jgi:hypothetical protein
MGQGGQTPRTSRAPHQTGHYIWARSATQDSNGILYLGPFRDTRFKRDIISGPVPRHKIQTGHYIWASSATQDSNGTLYLGPFRDTRFKRDINCTSYATQDSNGTLTVPVPRHNIQTGHYIWASSATQDSNGTSYLGQFRDTRQHADWRMVRPSGRTSV